MKFEFGNTIVLGILALMAFATVIFGFARINSDESKELTFAEERQKVVESAQLWHVRPVGKGGGGMSFDSLDFARLGFNTPPHSLQFKGSEGIYSINERQLTYFLQSSIDLKTNEEAIDTIRFDTLP